MEFVQQDGKLDTLEELEGLEGEEREGAAAALSIMPYLSGVNQWAQTKAEYLSLRATGFPVKEAVRMINISLRSIQRWRKEDARFLEIETAISGPNRSKVRKEVILLKFTRNLTMVLNYDEMILRRATRVELDASGDFIPMTKDQLAYLNRLRGFYGPSQMLAMESMLKNDGEDDENTDYAEFMRRLMDSKHGDAVVRRVKMEVEETRVANGHTVETDTARLNAGEG